MRSIKGVGWRGGLGSRSRGWLGCGSLGRHWRSGGSLRRRWRPERPPSAHSPLPPFPLGGGGGVCAAATTAAATATPGAAGRASFSPAGCFGARSLRGAAAPAAPAVAGPWGRAAAGRGTPFPAEKAPRPGADAALSPHTRPLRDFPLLSPPPPRFFPPLPSPCQTEPFASETPCSSPAGPGVCGSPRGMRGAAPAAGGSQERGRLPPRRRLP